MLICGSQPSWPLSPEREASSSLPKSKAGLGSGYCLSQRKSRIMPVLKKNESRCRDSARLYRAVEVLSQHSKPGLSVEQGLNGPRARCVGW